MKFRLLQADEIDCRISAVGNWGVQLLLYKDARCDMNILDETIGVENWQRKHELINGNLFCSVGIWTENGWVWKQDVGTESYTEKEKGQASDSFKRACFNIGIGRELYTAPSMFIYAKDLKTLKEVNGKWTCKDFFNVTDITYDGRRIATVTIVNVKTGYEFSFGTPVTEQRRQEEVRKQTVGVVKAKALGDLCNQKNVMPETVCARYGVEKLADLTEAQYISAVRALDKTEKK